MEHHDALPAIAVLSAAAVVLVAWSILPGTFLFGGNGHVFPGAPLDGQPVCSGGGGSHVFFQRADAAFADVAEQHRGDGMAALGFTGWGTGVEPRGTMASI